MNPFAVGLATAAIAGYRAFKGKAKNLAHIQEHTKHLATISGVLKGLKEQGHTTVHLGHLYEEHLRPRGVPEDVFDGLVGKLGYGKHKIDDVLNKVHLHMGLNEAAQKELVKSMGSPMWAGVKSALKWGLGAATATALGQKAYESLSAPPQPAFISPDYQEEMETLMKFV